MTLSMDEMWVLWSRSLVPLCNNTDILVHECTIGPTLMDIYKSSQNPMFTNFFKQYEKDLGREWFVYKGQKEVNELYSNANKRNVILEILSEGFFYEKYMKWCSLAGHSTSAMVGMFDDITNHLVGQFAKDIQAKNVFLNHISHRYFTYNQEIKIDNIATSLINQNQSNRLSMDSQDILDVTKVWFCLQWLIGNREYIIMMISTWLMTFLWKCMIRKWNCREFEKFVLFGKLHADSVWIWWLINETENYKGEREEWMKMSLFWFLFKTILSLKNVNSSL